MPGARASRPAATTPGGAGRLSPRAQRREALVDAIKAIHAEVKARYGSPRIHAELVARGQACCVNTVARLMREHGIAAKTKRKFRCTTDSNHDRPVAENVVDRQFEPEAAEPGLGGRHHLHPDPRGVAVPGGGGGPATRGGSSAGRWPSGSTAGWWSTPWRWPSPRRLPGAGLVAHSDRGSQYASEHYQRLLAGHGITCSMSRRANCWDNAPMESFFASLKKELVHDEDYATRAEARASIFEYIEVFYNRVRRHSSLGYRSPAEYERAG